MRNWNENLYEINKIYLNYTENKLTEDIDVFSHYFKFYKE